jgi:hypothetical protein
VSPRAQRPNWTVENARTGLTAAGWAITEFTVHPSPASITCTTDATSQETCTFTSTTATVTAERDGLILRGTATDFLADKSGDAWTGGVEGELFAARGAAYLPLIITGGLLGALAGWLLIAALAYRMRCLPPGSGRLAVAFTGVTATIAVPAVWAVIVNAVMLGEHLTDNGPVYTLHAALLPGSHLDGVAAWLIPGCTIATAAAAAITVGILVRGVVHPVHHAVPELLFLVQVVVRLFGSDLVPLVVDDGVQNFLQQTPDFHASSASDALCIAITILSRAGGVVKGLTEFVR